MSRFFNDNLLSYIVIPITCILWEEKELIIEKYSTDDKVTGATIHGNTWQCLFTETRCIVGNKMHQI